MIDRIVFVPDIADMLGVSYDTAFEYCNRTTGDYPFPEHAGAASGNRKYWRIDDVLAWMETRPGVPGRPKPREDTA